MSLLRLLDHLGPPIGHAAESTLDLLRSPLGSFALALAGQWWGGHS